MYWLFKICLHSSLAGILFTLLLASPGLTMTLPTQGQVNNSTETFTGAAVVHFWGNGSLTLLTNKGITCKGDFVHVSSQEGTGTVVCEDGRLGTFSFVMAGLKGTGNGKIGGENFDFRIGNK